MFTVSGTQESEIISNNHLLKPRSAYFRFCCPVKKNTHLYVDFNIGQAILSHIRLTIHKLIPVALLVLWNDWHVMPLCWQKPKCLPYLDCSITLSFISQFYPNASYTFTILYISQFSVAFLLLKTKYDFKGQRADRHRWEKMISNQGALATEWHCNYLWCPVVQTNRHIHWQILSRRRGEKSARKNKTSWTFLKLLLRVSHLASLVTLSSISHPSVSLTSLDCLVFFFHSSVSAFHLAILQGAQPSLFFSFQTHPHSAFES